MKKSQKMVIADLKHPKLWGYIKRGMDAQSELDKANRDTTRRISGLVEFLKKCKSPIMYKKHRRCLKYVRKLHYEIVTLAEFKAKERSRLLGYSLRRIPQAQYNLKYSCVVHRYFMDYPDHSESFTLFEFWGEVHSYVTQYFHSPEGWFARIVDPDDRSTWITRPEVQNYCQKRKMEVHPMLKLNLEDFLSHIQPMLHQSQIEIGSETWRHDTKENVWVRQEPLMLFCPVCGHDTRVLVLDNGATVNTELIHDPEHRIIQVDYAGNCNIDLNDQTYYCAKCETPLPEQSVEDIEKKFNSVQSI